MEEEVNYATLDFKNVNVSPPKATNEEETVYDTINTHDNEPDQTSEAKDKKSANGSYHIQLVAICLGILCLILVLAIIALVVYFARALNENDLSQKLQLSRENINLEMLMEQVKSARYDLNWTLVQWSVDKYCPKELKGRDCQPCQDGWLHHSSSCYAINDAQPDNRRSWQEARDDCRGKNSDLTVIDSPQEQAYIYESSWSSNNQHKGFWIGLTSESGRWHWVDGRNLTEEYWITPPKAGDGLCATSVKDAKPHGWYAVNCTAKNKWICEMKALTV